MVIDARQFIRRSGSGSVKQNTQCTRSPRAQRVHPDYATTLSIFDAALRVDECDLSSELACREILIPPNSLSDGVRVTFITENRAPIELLEFTDPKHPARLSNQMDE